MNINLPSVSIIVPAYNSERTIEICLQSIVRQMNAEDELIVVDDGSPDQTGNIARRYANTITHLKNRGLPAARQSGLNTAKFDLCVYFDSDTELTDECLIRIKKVFAERQHCDAVTGTYSMNQPFDCMWSKYKSYTTSFNMDALPEEIAFLHGAVFAVRKQGAPRFDGIQNFYGEDAAYGQLLIESGKKIYFAKDVKVRHHHKHTIFSALQHSYFISEGMIKLFLHHEGWKASKQNRGSFGSAPKSLLVSLLFPAMIVIHFFLAVFINLKSFQVIALLFFLWFLINLRFFLFCSKSETNTRFLTFLLPMTFLDQLVRLIGLFAGGVSLVIESIRSKIKRRFI